MSTVIDYETNHRDRIRAIAPECMVLLKSNGDFPLKRAGEIALYGNGARRTLKGGRGSADVNVKYYPTIEQGLLHAGFTITTTAWLDGYEEKRAEANKVFRSWLKAKIAAEGMDRLMENLSIVMPEPEYELSLQGEGDTAIYVLSRLCGEGVDRQDVAGDFRLSATEIRDILALQKQYKRFLLVLNVGCIVDLSPVANAVDNILLLSQVGMTIGDSFADVLLGKAYPSGKLAATWAAAEDYCDIGEFGDRNDTRYKEGIYVGYRYFDTMGIKPLFPFGYGLAYTTFAITALEAVKDGTKVRIPVQVINTGKCPGKEVVQLYVSLPQGRLNQPTQVLAAFVKTRELAPQEETTVVLECALEDLLSTDTKNEMRILEPGDYICLVGNSSRNTTPVCLARLDAEAVIEIISSVGGTTDFPDYRPAKKLSAVTHIEHLQVLSYQAEEFTPIVHVQPKPDILALALATRLTDEELAYLCTGDFIGEGSKQIIGDSALTLVGAAGETTGRFKEFGIQNLIMADGPSGIRITREYGVDDKGTYPIESKEVNLMELENKFELIPEPIVKALQAMMPLENNEGRQGEVYEQNCSAIPIATAIAQSFSIAVAEECADIVAEEMEHFGIDIWLAPALNIQRSPLCGRTFEYYSEDPYVSGKMAAAMTRGIQSHPGRCVTIKHFICNNQEANRFRTSSMVNERTLRDIYARGFEIVVKEAQPMAFMSSYNLLNGIHTSEREDLLETLLRKEWGYEGMVMSDFMTGDKSASDDSNKYRKFATAESIKAGNDLMMPGGKAHFENILEALDGENAECRLTRRELERSAARNISLAWKLRGNEMMKKRGEK